MPRVTLYTCFVFIYKINRRRIFLSGTYENKTAGRICNIVVTPKIMKKWVHCFPLILRIQSSVQMCSNPAVCYKVQIIKFKFCCNDIISQPLLNFKSHFSQKKGEFGIYDSIALKQLYLAPAANITHSLKQKANDQRVIHSLSIFFRNHVFKMSKRSLLRHVYEAGSDKIAVITIGTIYFNEVIILQIITLPLLVCLKLLNSNINNME